MIHVQIASSSLSQRAHLLWSIVPSKGQGKHRTMEPRIRCHISPRVNISKFQTPKFQNHKSQNPNSRIPIPKSTTQNPKSKFQNSKIKSPNSRKHPKARFQNSKFKIKKQKIQISKHCCGLVSHTGSPSGRGGTECGTVTRGMFATKNGWRKNNLAMTDQPTISTKKWTGDTQKYPKMWFGVLGFRNSGFGDFWFGDLGS